MVEPMVEPLLQVILASFLVFLLGEALMKHSLRPPLLSLFFPQKIQAPLVEANVYCEKGTLLGWTLEKAVSRAG